jgi:ubiquinone biosynthesis protein
MRSLVKHTHRERYRQIAHTLARHGLGYLVGILGLERFVPFHKGLLKHPKRPQPYTRPEHVRMALEELGATFIKLGQMLSIRTDLLPPDYQAEFAKLQDAAPTVPLEQVQAALLEELGQPLDALFTSFDPVPLAAASIGQAHAATLPDGTEVVLKIRRPGVVEQIEEDLTILHNLAVTASQRWDLAAQYDVVALVDEFAQTLRAELDYVQEGHNAERFAANFAGDTTVHIPRIFWDTTTSCVLTLKRIYGIKINDLAALDAARIDRAVVAERAANIILKMVFEDGFFHADPHPGNFFIEQDGVIGMIDYGMVGTVDTRTQEHLVRLLLALASQDADRVVDAFLELGVTRQQVDRFALRADLERWLAHYYGQALGEIALGPMMNEMLTIVRRHHLHLPTNLALLVKTTVMNESLGMQLDPSFRLTSVIMPYAQRLLLRQYSPLFWTKRIGQAGMDAAWLTTELPQQVRRLLGELERGNLKIEMQMTDVEPMMRRMERLVNRLILAIITGAFIIGLGMLMAFFHPPGGQWVWVWFAAGFAIVAVLGLYLVWSILRPRRH